jgi:predicted nucleotidyltransferase
MTRDHILETVRRRSDDLRRLSVRELSLFGSYARGDAGDRSDIDFIVEFEQKSFDNYMAVKELLESLFAMKVDLVIKSAIKPRLRDAILREAVRAA